MIAQINKDYIRTRPWKLVSRLISYALFEGRPVTTRGQWINSLVFFLFTAEKSLFQMKKVKKPIFILGTGRSGTTILGVLLSMHRDVGFLNEPKALWHSLHPGEDLIGSYSRGAARYRLDERDATPRRVTEAHRIYGAYLAATCSRRVVDKYPELIFRVPFVRALFPDARFLFLVRNGWNTCASIEGWSKRLGKEENGEVLDWWGVNDRKWDLLVSQIVEGDPDLAGMACEIKGLRRHAERAMIEWIVTMREGMKLMQDPELPILMVKYEDMVLAPESAMKNIAEFCGLSHDRKMIDYAVRALSPQGPRKPFGIRPDILRVFEETMEALGYKT